MKKFVLLTIVNFLWSVSLIAKAGNTFHIEMGEYPSYDEIYTELLADDSIKVLEGKVWTAVEQEINNKQFLWLFTTSSNSAHPSYVKRSPIIKNFGISVETKILCEQKEECQNLKSQFEEIDKTIQLVPEAPIQWSSSDIESETLKAKTSTKQECSNASYQMLVGKWYLEKRLTEKVTLQALTERFANGSFKIELKYRHADKIESQNESVSGLWAFSQCLYTTYITEASNGKSQHVYLADSVEESLFEYLTLEDNIRYSEHRVSNSFTLDELSSE